MGSISIDGRSYDTIPVARLDRLSEHPFFTPLNLEPSSLAWLRPETLYIGERRKKRPVLVRGVDGKELVFSDRFCELVLCTDENLLPPPRQETPTLRTSDIRKHALKLAYEYYENCSGQLKFSTFDINEGSRELGFADEADAQAIFSYLTSSGIMESPYLGSGRVVRFTDYGISAIEAGIDKPDESSGPFPPLNVVVGDIGAGAQVAIGTGDFRQERNDAQNPNLLRDLVPLLRAVSEQAGDGSQATILLKTAENEAEDGDCDMGFLQATLAKFAKSFAKGVVEPAASAASQSLLAYCKAHGLLP
jgi:hypothetical protein